MTFQVSRPKTKAAKARKARVSEPPKADVTPISIDAMVMTSPRGKSYFKRLKYKGCPTLVTGGQHNATFHPDTELVDMQRDDFVRQMYTLFTVEELNKSSNTLKSYFDSLRNYVTALDVAGRVADLSEENINWYMGVLFAQQQKGELKKGTLGNRKNAISFLLRQLGREKDARELPSNKGIRKATKSAEPMDDNDHTDSYKILLKAYTTYALCLAEGQTPEHCPIFNESLIRQMKNSDGSPRYSEKEINHFRGAAKKRITRGDWRNMMTRIAFLLVARPTGANLTPLANLKRKHVRLKKIEGDKYVFDLATIKGRAQFEEQSIKMGFNKREKELLEGWLETSSKFAKSEDDYLFPSFDRNGQLKHIGQQPQFKINKALKPYELEAVTCRKFRATRSSKHLRATGSLVETADANRNAVGTTKRSYFDGNQQTNEIEMAGAMIAQGKIMNGADKRTAIDEVKAKFKEPLSDFEYQQKKGKSANKTTTGVRCGDPHGDKAKKSMRKHAKIVKELETQEELDTCIDFLECFDCPNHVLISEVDDIWLMLSFRDSIITSLSRPSFNSDPSKKMGELMIKVDAALESLKDDAPDNYAKAKEKNDKEPHPLYDDEYAFEDMMGIYS